MYTIFHSGVSNEGVFFSSSQLLICESFDVGDIMVTAVSRCGDVASTIDAAKITISGLKQIIYKYAKSITADRYAPNKLIRLLLVRLQHMYRDYRKDHPEGDTSADLSFVIANRKSGDCCLIVIGGAPLLVLNESMKISVRLLSDHRNCLYCDMYKEARACSLFVKGSFFWGDYRAIMILGGDIKGYDKFNDELINKIYNDDKEETAIKKLLDKETNDTKKLFPIAAILNDDPVQLSHE